MQMKIKEKIIAVVMAFAMMFTCIFAGESNEVIAAAKTKALEINVDFARNAASGADSGIYIKSLTENHPLVFIRSLENTTPCWNSLMVIMKNLWLGRKAKLPKKQISTMSVRGK